MMINHMLNFLQFEKNAINDVIIYVNVYVRVMDHKANSTKIHLIVSMRGTKEFLKFDAQSDSHDACNIHTHMRVK